jgi:glycosyltransferase involved in cell wall biosynthesis
MHHKEIVSVQANQHPHKINHLSRFLRKITSFAPLFNLVKPSERPQGISVIMRVKDERDWIELSVESIKKIADEIIVVDNGSTDGTYEILKDIADREKELIKLWQKPELQHCDLSNFALEKTSFGWILRWDGDMVSHSSGDYDIANLRKRIISLNPRRYYLIYLRHINLSGDLFHQDPKEIVHTEEYVHTFSPQARFVHPKRFEAVKFPIYYQPLFWYEPYSFHINVKSSRRMLFRYFWEDWMEMKDYERFPTLEGFVNVKIEQEFGTNSWEEAQNMYISRALQDHIRYDPDIFGPYPDLLKSHLDHPKYTIKYKDNKIVGRSEP